jgi:peroxiredoxin (alkyl hydroperoxide reductase subunit C)
MASLVTKAAPDFTAKAVMPDHTFEDLQLSKHHGKYVVLFFYPLDFTFICPTEILAFNERIEAFRERNAEVIGISVDSEYTHYAWRTTPPEQGGIGAIRYPLVADLDKNIARAYGVLIDEKVALRGLFLIDRKGIVRHELVNDLGIGRNVDEALRVLDALRFCDEHGDVCPANWNLGDETLKPTAEGVALYLSTHSG